MSLLAANNGTSSSFIRNFARPIDLAALSNGNSAPTYLLIDIPNISASLFDDKSIRLVRESNGTFAEVLKDEASSIFEKIDKSYIINSSLQIVDLDIQQDVGFVKIHKRRIALAEFDSSIADIFVEDPQFEIGGTQDRISLRRYIDRENLFTVLFSDYTLAYMGGTLYRDEGLLNGGKNFLDRFSVEAELSHTDSEKGSFSINQKEFSPKSVFRVLTDHIAKNSNILVCDDLGDEWADFVSIETVSGSPVLSFYHAKHGKLSLGASVFHDSVGQAMKNLGRMDLPSEMMPSKLDSWETPYRNDETVTAIPRILRGGARIKVSTEIDSVRGSPNLIKRVFIVTSSLSLSQLKAAFDDVSKGGQPAPYFVQLYWILNAYFSACAEVGAVGCVVCQP